MYYKEVERDGHPISNCYSFHTQTYTHFFMMSYNTDFVEARADDIFDGWVTSFFRDLTPTDESALYSLALDKAIEEAN